MDNKDKIISLYFFENKKPVDIAKQLHISKSAVSQILQKDIRYSKEKERRKKVNQIKHNEKTKEFIKKKRKIEHLDNEQDYLALQYTHAQASVELSKRNKLSNLAYRTWNKSAYHYNSQKKRYEFKEKLGRSYDVPKYIKNTNV